VLTSLRKNAASQVLSLTEILGMPTKGSRGPGPPPEAGIAVGGCATMLHLGLDVSREYVEVGRPTARGCQSPQCSRCERDGVKVCGLAKPIVLSCILLRAGVNKLC